MNDIHPDDIPVVERILTDCAETEDSGAAIRRGGWGIFHVDGVWYLGSSVACCPGGAVIMAAKDLWSRLPDDDEEALSALVGRSHRWVDGFITGVDNRQAPCGEDTLRGYAAGLAVAAALWGET